MNQHKNNDKDDEKVDNVTVATAKKRQVHRDVCVCPETGKIKGLADMWKSKDKCEMYACHNGGLITVMKCGRFLYDKENPRPECKIKPEEPGDKKFPQCCEYIECTKQPENMRKGLEELTYPLSS